MEQTNELIVRNDHNERNKDIFGFFKYLFQMKFVLIAAVGIGALLSSIYVFIVAKPIYEATSQIYMVNSKESIVNLSDLQIGSYLTSDYQWIFQTWEVNQEVIDNLNLPYTVKQMKDNLQVNNPYNTRVLTITFSSPDPKEAADVANEYSTVASQYIYDALQTSMPSIISVALEPIAPVRPRKLLVISISAALCGLLAAWILFISFLCNDKIKNEDDLQKYMNIIPLATIPRMSTNGETKNKKAGKQSW